MAEKITFPRIPPARWVFDRDCVEFPARRGETNYRCLASLELLIERFGARFPNPADKPVHAAGTAFEDPIGLVMLQTYEMNRERLQQIAKAQILTGRVVNGNEIHLKTDSYAFKEVRFSEGVQFDSYHFGLVRQITGELEQVLGESACHVTVEWERIGDAAGRPLYMLGVQDFSGRVSIAFTPAELVHSPGIRVQLYRLWGDLLQDRNHKQLQELLGAGNQEA